MNERVTPRTLVLTACVVLAACGDIYADPIEESPTSPRFGIEPPPAPSVDPTTNGPSLPCPDTPIEGAACGVSGLTCEYGASPDPMCNTTVSCIALTNRSGTWTARPSKLCPTYDCPRGSIGNLDGTPCDLPRSDAGGPSDADELACPMDDGICACTTGRDAAHAHPRRWVCVLPRPTCPVVRPLTGQSCVSTRVCDYGSCVLKHGVQMSCNGTVWTSGGAACD